METKVALALALFVTLLLIMIGLDTEQLRMIKEFAEDLDWTSLPGFFSNAGELGLDDL